MSYVLLFRTHFWDDFTQRAFDRIREHAPGGSVYVAADETFREVPCPPEYKLAHSVEKFAGLGLNTTAVEQVMWYNGDYPMYSAFLELPRFDYIIMVEFDVVVNVNFDEVIAQLKAARGDAVTRYLQPAAPDWPWKETADPVYSEVYGSLNPVLILSRKAVSNLYYARLAQSHQYNSGKIEKWAYCEAFIASQLKKANLKTQELDEFGRTFHFSWWPPMEEELVLNHLRAEAFVHPVLAGDAYLKSLARYEVLPNGAANQRSQDDWDAEFRRLKRERMLEPQPG